MATDKKTLIKYTVIAAVGLVVLWYAKDKIKDVANSVNPLNYDNIFNTGFNATTNALTGSDMPIGTKVYDWLHDVNGNNVVNPWNPNNPINELYDYGYKSLTGSTGTVGGDIYGFTEGVGDFYKYKVGKTMNGGFSPFNPMTWFQ